MSTPVVFNGVNYSIPAFGDVGYAQGPGNLSSFLIAVATGTLQPSGGLFSLTSDANFGPNFGLVSVYYKTTTANIATAGQFRLAVTDTIQWRNNTNTLNLPLAVNGSDQLTFNGALLSTAATNGTVSASGTGGRLSVYPAPGNTVDDVYVQNGRNIAVEIALQAARASNLIYTIPNPGDAAAAATFALLELAQTFTAAQTFAATLTSAISGATTTNFIISNTTNGQAGFVTTSTNASGVNLDRGVNENPLTHIFTKTGQGSSIIRQGSTSSFGNVEILASSVNNTNATSCATFSDTGCALKGTTTNNAAAAGFVGEFKEATSTVFVNAAATGTLDDLVSVALTPGDWMITGMLAPDANGGTYTAMQVGITPNAGNNSAGFILGTTMIRGLLTAGSTNPRNWPLTIAPMRVSLSVNTTYYLKRYFEYTAGTPGTQGGRLSAWRIR